MPHHEYTEETQAKLKALQELIEQQAAQIEALRADAMRYRYLRDNGYLANWLPVGYVDTPRNIDAVIYDALTGQ